MAIILLHIVAFFVMAFNVASKFEILGLKMKICFF